VRRGLRAMGRSCSTLAVTVALPTPPCSPCVPVRVTPRPGRPADRRSCFEQRVSVRRFYAVVPTSGRRSRAALGLPACLETTRATTCGRTVRANSLASVELQGCAPRRRREQHRSLRSLRSLRRVVRCGPYTFSFNPCLPGCLLAHGCRTRRASRRRAGKQAPHPTDPDALSIPPSGVGSASEPCGVASARPGSHTCPARGRAS
jgi:hypothetical protein